MNVGFFNGAVLKDPAGLLVGTGKRMRHVKLKPGRELDRAALGDLIEALRIPMILVAGTYLGSLNHVLTAFEVISNRGLDIAALVLNETPRSPVPIAATEASLANFCGDVPMVALRRGGENNAAAFEVLADLLR